MGKVSQSYSGKCFDQSICNTVSFVTVVVGLMLPPAYCAASNVCTDQKDKKQEGSWSGRASSSIYHPTNPLFPLLMVVCLLHCPRLRTKSFRLVMN